MKKHLVYVIIFTLLVACNNSNESSTKDLDGVDSTSAIDTLIHQDTLTDYDGKRL